MSDTPEQPNPSATAKVTVEAIARPDIPHVYFNEFATFYGSSDIVSVLAANERFVAVLHMSASVAKSFGQQLLGVVNQFEQKTQQQVLTLEEANSRIKSQSGGT